MLHQTFLFLGQLWQLFDVSQIVEFLRYSLISLFTFLIWCSAIYLTGNGFVDAEEYEYVMSDFGVPSKDAKNAFLMFSKVKLFFYISALSKSLRCV